MTFLADDSGIQTSKPVELYEFTDTRGTVYRRTSYYRDFNFITTYLATPGLKRSAAPIVNGEDVPEMMIEMPITSDVVAAFAGCGVVPQGWRVRVLRIQRTSGELQQVWNGFVHSIDLSNDKIAVFTSRGLLDGGPNTPIPNVVLSPLCGHVLYSPLCGASRAANEVNPTIVNVNGRFITISSSPFAGAAGKFGDAVHPFSGERRSIVGQSGNVVELDVPLPSGGPYAAAIGQVLTLVRGCNRDVKTCRDVFSNVVNFAGDPQAFRGDSFWPKSILDLKGGD